jgi:cyclopropane fatty-acyl-phospholipid synthase-like methyltransferase
MSDPRVEIVAAGYDRMADTFAEWRDRIEGDPRAEWCAELVSRLPDGACVLELGCGAGNSAETQELARRFRLTGVDVSAEQIRRAQENAPGAELVHADFLELALPAESFDAICSFYVFNHVPRERLGPLLERIAGWLRPGGLTLNAFGVTDLPGWTGEWLGAETFFAGFEPPENSRLVEAAGLTILRDEVVEFVEPEGPVQFQWILARR